MDIVERLRNFETSNVDLLFLKNDAAFEIERLRDEVDFQLHKRKEDAAEIERLRKVVALLIEYEEHDKNILKGAVMWEALIEAAHRALMEKE
jgi:hypothetical protein